MKLTYTTASALLLSVFVGIIIGCCEGTRSRISQYIVDGQLFLVGGGVLLFENPASGASHYDDLVMWFCPPAYEPDLNGDGKWDNVVGHGLLFIPDDGLEGSESSAPGSVSGTWVAKGYTAAWSPIDGRYDEKIIDVGVGRSSTSTVMDIGDNQASFVVYEPSSGQADGYIVSGEGVWTFNTTGTPGVEKMATALGKELTAENCKAKYAEVWNLMQSTSAGKTPFASMVLLLSLLSLFLVF